MKPPMTIYGFAAAASVGGQLAGKISVRPDLRIASRVGFYLKSLRYLIIHI